MYNSIKGEIQVANRNKEIVVIVGDFNCKVGKVIENNNEEVSKSGKLLSEMIEDMKRDQL